MRQLKQLPREGQTRVMFLHSQAFGGDSACKPCKGNCCSHCAANKGFLRDIMTDHQWSMFARKYNFSTVKGFQTEQGCALPMAERSSTCLTFMCPGTTTDRGYGPPKDKPFEEHRIQAVEDMLDIFIDTTFEEPVQKKVGTNAVWPFPGRN